jgi:hypothetical protein
MLLSSTWRVGVGKGFTLPHLHGHTVVKVLSFLLILPDTLGKRRFRAKRIARIHVARSRHRSTIGPKRAIGAFSPKYPSCRTRCPQPTRSCERETLRLELSGNRDQRQHSLQYATTGHPLMSKIITEPVFSASIISHCFHSFKR